MAVRAPPDICALRFTITTPWCSKVSGDVARPPHLASETQESWGGDGDCHSAGGVTRGWTHPHACPEAGRMLGEGSPASSGVAHRSCRAMTRGKPHIYWDCWWVPPDICGRSCGGVELGAKSISDAKVTRETAPAWLGTGGFGCCFNGIPASITLSGDTFKKKKKRIPNNTVSSFT